MPARVRPPARPPLSVTVCHRCPWPSPAVGDRAWGAAPAPVRRSTWTCSGADACPLSSWARPVASIIQPALCRRGRRGQPRVVADATASSPCTIPMRPHHRRQESASRQHSQADTSPRSRSRGNPVITGNPARIPRKPAYFHNHVKVLANGVWVCYNAFERNDFRASRRAVPDWMGFKRSRVRVSAPRPERKFFPSRHLQTLS